MATRDTITAGTTLVSPYTNEPTHVVAVCDFAACTHGRKARPDQVHVRAVDGDAEWWLRLVDGIDVVTCPDGCDDDTVGHRFANSSHERAVAELRKAEARDRAATKTARVEAADAARA